MNETNFLETLRGVRVVPVIRLASRAASERAARWCVEEGFPVVEITLTCPEATTVIAALAEAPGVTVGAGTVLDLEGARRVLEAGARFVVSPAAVEGLVEAVLSAGAAALPGALSPSEVLARAREGATAVKVFPAKQAGGPAYLKALRQVFPEVPLMPTGGITPEDIGGYLAAGAIAVGIGGDLVDAAEIEAGDRAAFAARAARLRAALRTAAA